MKPKPIQVRCVIRQEHLQGLFMKGDHRVSQRALREYLQGVLDQALAELAELARRFHDDDDDDDDDEPRHDLREHPLDADGLYRCMRCGYVGGYTGGPVECGEELDADGCNECDGQRLLACCDYCRDRPHRHDDRRPWNDDGRLTDPRVMRSRQGGGRR